MATALPNRPNLEHLRRQAKTLLAAVKDGDAAAAKAVIAHLPSAAKLTPAKVRAADLRLADAQSVVARQSGFASWTKLVRHIEVLRGLEGEWHFAALQVNGDTLPAAAFANSRLLMDGDRFRTESAEANYDGVFSIDTSVEPARIDIEFIEGPEAGNWSYGIFELQRDQLTICLGLTGAPRPAAFATRAGSGHALERLTRASAARPTGVTGGSRASAAVAAAKPTRTPRDGSPVDTTGFDGPITPWLERLGGEWIATKFVRDGEEMRADWLSYGSRITSGAETRVLFGGQVMLHARMRIDDTVNPPAVDYLHLSGSSKGKIGGGIVDWVGDEVRFLIASPGQSRPADFSATGKGLTFSQWKRKP